MFHSLVGYTKDPWIRVNIGSPDLDYNQAFSVAELLPVDP